MRIVSWNVNGLRSAASKGFLDWLQASDADVVGLQEVRAHPHQLPPLVREPEGWHTHFVPAQRPGYSGVGLYSKIKPDAIETSLGEESFDTEGRLVIARYGDLVIANVYFPNGNGKDRDNSRIPYKLAFYRRLHAKLETFRQQGDKVIVMGDFNTAHREIDLARPKENEETSGFRPEEREEIERWLQSGFVDTFRVFDQSPGRYTWWSQRAWSRQRNVGWRIDYVLACPLAAKLVKRAFISPDVFGSDHCPVGVDC